LARGHLRGSSGSAPRTAGVMTSLTDRSVAYLLPRALGAVLSSVTGHSKRTAARMLLQAMGPARQRVLNLVFDLVKDAATKDPDMLECAKVQVRFVIDCLAADVESQSKESLRLGIGSGIGVVADNSCTSPKKRGGSSWRCGCYMRLRACVLYHVFPFDKTVWGSIRDPIFWLVLLPCLVVAYNVRCTVLSFLLLLLVCPGPPDENMLSKFIVVLKVNQFLTVGVGCILVGAVEYYMCILFEPSDMRQCVEMVTMESLGVWFSLLDYCGGFLLTQVTMLAFYWSQQLVPLPSEHAHSPPGMAARRSRTVASREPLACCCIRTTHPAPFRLRILMRYDLICFLGSVALMALLTYVGMRHRGQGVALICARSWSDDCIPDPTLALNAYWCRALYGLTAAPWLLVWILDFTPVTFSLVNQSYRTGYNREGDCVLFRMRQPDPESLDADSDGSSSDGSEMSDAASIGSASGIPPGVARSSGWFGYAWSIL